MVLKKYIFLQFLCSHWQGTKQQLTDLAIQLGAPFAKTALERLHGSIFGSGRAARSTDVAIINKSKHSFKLAGNSCSHGVYSTGLFPEFDIAAKSSSVFGVESHGLFTGVECTTRYQSADGAFFEVRSNNPYVGSVDGKILKFTICRCLSAMCDVLFSFFRFVALFFIITNRMILICFVLHF